MTRSTREMQQAERIPKVPLEKIEPTKKIHGKEITQEKSQEEVLQEQLREAREELIEAKLEFEEMKKRVLEQLDFDEEIAEKPRKRQMEFYHCKRC